MASQAAAIAAENTYCGVLPVEPGPLNVSVYGTFAAIVTLQRSFDSGSTWLDVMTYAAPAEDVVNEAEYALYRIGVKSGDYSTGTVNVRIGC